MPGVKEVEEKAFKFCYALTYIECGKLETIGENAFCGCRSLSNVDLPSVKIVDGCVFNGCTNLRSVKFGKGLESFGRSAFYGCCSLECITLPLKDGMISDDDIFPRCDKLNRVDLVGGVHETVAALLLEQWKSDMNEEIDAINQILPNTPVGVYRFDGYRDTGEKAQAIRLWIASVLHKIIHYKTEHRRYLNVAADSLQPALPNDILFNNVLPFLELPSDTFDGEE